MIKLKISSKQLLVFFLLIFAFLISRTYQLVKLPVFCDEAIYIRWAQVMRNEQSLRFLPLQDGKQPLFMWLVIPALKLFSNPLFAGRIVSVFAGLATMLGTMGLMFILAQSISLGLISGIVYLLAPFCFFFDRMALVDVLLSAFGVWSLILAILLGKNRRLDLAMILGIVLGGAMLTKSPGFLFLAMSLPISFIFMIKGKKKKDSLFLWGLKSLALLATSFVFALVIYNILRLGPNFHMIAIRNKDYVWPVSEIIKHPLDPLRPHIRDIYRYYWRYLTPPFIILALIGVLSVKKDLIFLLLIGWWLSPLLGQSTFAKVFTARYILFSLPVFILFISWGIEKILSFCKKEKWKIAVFGLIAVLPALIFNYQLWFNPEKAPLPRDEKAGYLEDWTAGQGLKEIADFLDGLDKDLNVIIGTEGYFGTLPDGLQIYLEGKPKRTVVGMGHPIITLPEPLIDAKEHGDRVYLVVNKSRFKIGENKSLKLINSYPKPGGDELLFFEVL